MAMGAKRWKRIRRSRREIKLLLSGGKLIAPCTYCRKEFPLRELTIDHIIPLSRNGSRKYHNLTLACSPCNNRKADKVQ